MTEEWKLKSTTAKTYIMVGVMSGMGMSRFKPPTSEQIEARRVLNIAGPAALDWCKAEAARMCDAEYGPNLTGRSEELFHCYPLHG